MAQAYNTVIIIGAGVAGIAAATKLLKNNFNNFIILEAENRIGGRIQTLPFGGNYYNLLIAFQDKVKCLMTIFT